MRVDCAGIVQVVVMCDGSVICGVRVGCELLNLSAEATRLLQRYIDQTQKRRRMMSLD